jgi:hypothetical protein
MSWPFDRGRFECRILRFATHRVPGNSATRRHDGRNGSPALTIRVIEYACEIALVGAIYGYGRLPYDRRGANLDRPGFGERHRAGLPLALEVIVDGEQSTAATMIAGLTAASEARARAGTCARGRKPSSRGGRAFCRIGRRTAHPSAEALRAGAAASCARPALSQQLPTLAQDRRPARHHSPAQRGFSFAGVRRCGAALLPW